MSEQDENLARCANCGAEFSSEAARCPYCGALNPAGAERAYMQELGRIEHETNVLDDAARDDFKANVGGNAKRIAIVALIAAAAIVAMLAIVHFSNQADEQRALDEYHAREAFREQHYAELDRLYEAGDDEALVDYALSLIDEPGSDALYSWQHYDYLESCFDRLENET